MINSNIKRKIDRYLIEDLTQVQPITNQNNYDGNKIIEEIKEYKGIHT